MNERNNNISITKAIGVVLVVLGHAITKEIRVDVQIWNYIFDFIYSFHMFLFFFWSGYLFQKNIHRYRINRIAFLKKKFIKLIVPYVFITCVEYASLFLLQHGSMINNNLTKIANVVLKNPVSFNTAIRALILHEGHFDMHLWFIYTLFWIFCINIFIISKNTTAIIVVVFCSFFRSFFSEIGESLASIIVWMVPFLLGRLYLEKQNSCNIHIVKMKCARFVGVLLCMCILNAIVGFVNDESCWWKNGIVQYLHYLTGMLGTVLIYDLAKEVQKSDVLQKLIRILHKYHYEIYLYHQPFVTALSVKLCYSLSKAALGSIIVGLVAGVIIPISISKLLLHKNKWIDMLVCGFN